MRSDYPSEEQPTTSIRHEGRLVVIPFLLAVLGIIAAAGGQVILLRTNPTNPRLGLMQALAGGLLAIGAILFGVGARRLLLYESRLEFGHSEMPAPLLDWRQTWVGVAIALAVLAIILFAAAGESPWIIGLWLGSNIVLLASQVRPRTRAPSSGLRGEWPYLIALAGILALALIIRIYHLSTLPYNLDGDFASFGIQARTLFSGPQPHLFAYAWASIPVLGYLPAWASMKLFGDGLSGLNASGVIEGSLSIIGVYLLGRDLYRPRVGVIAAALLGGSYAHIAASRQSAYIDPVFFLVFAIYFLLLGFREGRGWPLVVSGIMTAFCFEVYYSGRLVIPIIGCLVIYMVIFHRAALARRLGWLSLWLLALLIALGPMLVVFQRGFDAFISRSREVFILNPDGMKHMMGVFRVDSVSALLWEQARRSLLLFHYYPDVGTQFGFWRPLLDPMTATLFTLGLGLALIGIRRLGSALLLSWIALGVIVGCFLTINPPFWARLMILLPPAAVLAALPLEAVYGVIDDSLRSLFRPGPLIAPVVLAFLLLWNGDRNWNTYVALKASYADGRTRIGRYMEDQSPGAKAYLVTSSDWTYRDREFEFLIPGRLVANLAPDQISANIPRVGTPTILMLTAEQTTLAQALPNLIPGGEMVKGPGNSPGEIAFYAYRLP